MKTVRELMGSKAIRTSAIIIGMLFISCISFAGGLAIGFHKAKFSYAFGENYERNFMQGRQWNEENHRGKKGEGMMGGRDFEGRGFRNSHGISGEILSVSDTSMIIKDTGDTENTIIITPSTIVKNGRDTIKATELSTGTKVVIIGKPTDTGNISADFIRVFPNDTR